MSIQICHLESPEDLAAVEKLQGQIWSGNDIEIVPAHMLLAALHNGGILIGAWDQKILVGFVFGFAGFKKVSEGITLQHCSHMLGVHPDYRDTGLGFKLKRAQWQMVRQQGLDKITWTYDPLLSRNAYLNIAKLGAVCNTYHPNYYGELRDQINDGLYTDRFIVDWWINTTRVKSRLGNSPRKRLDLAHYLSAEIPRVNETKLNKAGLIVPQSSNISISSIPLLLVEIPADFQKIKIADPGLALQWRLHTRSLFEDMFSSGYLVTDFVYLSGSQPRSYYVLSYGESTF